MNGEWYGIALGTHRMLHIVIHTLRRKLISTMGLQPYAPIHIRSILIFSIQFSISLSFDTHTQQEHFVSLFTHSQYVFTLEYLIEYQ